MEQARIPPSAMGSWGYPIYEQDSTSILKKHDEPRPGDVVALHDTRLKGRKGIQSYEQHVGSVEDPLVGVIAEYEPKNKRKIKVIQVDRGVIGEISYRLDDVKSGRVVVYRVGV